MLSLGSTETTLLLYLYRQEVTKLAENYNGVVIRNTPNLTHTALNLKTIIIYSRIWRMRGVGEKDGKGSGGGGKDYGRCEWCRETRQ